MDTLDRFLIKVAVVDSGCHEWTSTLHRDGYGKFWYKKKQIQAHRVSYELQIGEIPSGKWILHKCDNRKCVNPEHLYIGTPKDNAIDRTDRCEWFGNMKYSKEVIDSAISLYKDGLSQQKIATLLGMHQTQVSRYVRKKQRVFK